jgi:hypothetical protein
MPTMVSAINAACVAMVTGGQQWGRGQTRRLARGGNLGGFVGGESGGSQSERWG